MPQFFRDLVSTPWRLAARRSVRRRLLLRYETTVAETADALILAYGRHAELRRPIAADVQAGADVERFSSDGREVVLLGFRDAGAACDFQRFWARYARVHGPAHLRDPAYDLAAPVPAMHAKPVAATRKVAPLAGPVTTTEGQASKRLPGPGLGGAGAGRGFLGAPTFRWRPGARDARTLDLRQALNEMESAGMQVRAVELSPDGTIKLITASARDDR